jgi:hypothetical protein
MTLEAQNIRAKTLRLIEEGIHTAIKLRKKSRSEYQRKQLKAWVKGLLRTRRTLRAFAKGKWNGEYV